LGVVSTSNPNRRVKFGLRFEPVHRPLRLTRGRPSDRFKSGLIKTTSKGAVEMRVTTDGRLLGFDFGDWSLLVVGFTVVGLLVFLV
jgi:hypothetical protein